EPEQAQHGQQRAAAPEAQPVGPALGRRLRGGRGLRRLLGPRELDQHGPSIMPQRRSAAAAAEGAARGGLLNNESFFISRLTAAASAPRFRPPGQSSAGPAEAGRRSPAARSRRSLAALAG